MRSLINRGGWKSIIALNFSLAFGDETDALCSIYQKGSPRLEWSYQHLELFLALQSLKPQLFRCSEAAQVCISDPYLIPGHYSLHFDAFHHQLSDAPPALPARTLRKVKRKCQESREGCRRKIIGS